MYRFLDTEPIHAVCLDRLRFSAHTGIVRRFELQRDFDITGVSGIGIVARGVRFDDGVTVIRCG